MCFFRPSVSAPRFRFLVAFWRCSCCFAGARFSRQPLSVTCEVCVSGLRLFPSAPCHIARVFIFFGILVFCFVNPPRLGFHVLRPVRDVFIVVQELTFPDKGNHFFFLVVYPSYPSVFHIWGVPRFLFVAILSLCRSSVSTNFYSGAREVGPVFTPVSVPAFRPLDAFFV